MSRRKHRKKKSYSNCQPITKYKLLATGVEQNPKYEHKDRYIIDYLVDRYSDDLHETHIEEKGKLEKKVCGSCECELDYFSIFYGEHGAHCMYFEAKSNRNGTKKAKYKQIPRGLEYISSKYGVPKDRIKSYVVWGDKDDNLYLHEVKQ